MVKSAETIALNWLYCSE